jgi:RNA polymerase sigma-70 factor (ECF subfamily)
MAWATDDEPQDHPASRSAINFDGPALLPERHDELWRAVRRLPPHQAKAVVLHYVDDCSVAEIASILGCADGTVKTHLHRARRTLADVLGHDAPRRTHDD